MRSLQVTTTLRHLTVLLLCALLGVGQAGAGSMTLLGVGGAAATNQPLLDTLSGTASIAYSTRKLRAAYAGKAMNVLRSSDSTTTDIGFAGTGQLDTTALATFCSATVCWINIWYDQSGNAVNATPVTVINSSPEIYSGGVTTLNGNPALLFNTANNGSAGLNFTASISQPDTIAIAAKMGTAVTNAHFTDGFSSSPRQLIGNSGSGAYNMYAGTTAATGGTLDTNPHALFGFYNGASSTLTVDGSVVITGTNIGTNSLGNQGIGSGLGVQMNGNIGEYIVFSAALSGADQTKIRTSWQTQWGTP